MFVYIHIYIEIAVAQYNHLVKTDNGSLLEASAFYVKNDDSSLRGGAKRVGSAHESIEDSIHCNLTTTVPISTLYNYFIHVVITDNIPVESKLEAFIDETVIFSCFYRAPAVDRKEGVS